ncbi:hypothetical protein N825_22870 [Skermanella stibiiresistens SB22]|uniref:Calcium-binding protein n=1 Tax=Skermanella stibiiresistens SB22 TaxID=1385369 RepID=W9GZP5_9PROT|nr:hypothetical protein [Skermanella stibiiresistens]EWY36958.1 hypothetical protein N825_22870 [Skermanella stibiiresistens SB22]
MATIRAKGDASTLGTSGADILYGGPGASRLYGGDGDDILHYSPIGTGPTPIAAALASSELSGGTGIDTLHIHGKTAPTKIIVTGKGEGGIHFEDTSGVSQGAGHFSGIEKLTVTGSGPLEFHGSWEFTGGIDVTGTAGADIFQSDSASDIMRSGGGDDFFFLSGYGGTDTIISGASDSDMFYFDVFGGADARILGFNGAGVDGGDKLFFQDMSHGRPLLTSIAEVGGRTQFTVQAAGGDYGPSKVVVDKVGLVEGVDYFFA